MLEIYSGLEIVKAMEKLQQAICIIGTFRNYVITMNEYGDIVWENNQIVGLDRFFIDSKWTLLIEKEKENNS